MPHGCRYRSLRCVVPPNVSASHLFHLACFLLLNPSLILPVQTETEPEDDNMTEQEKLLASRRAYSKSLCTLTLLQGALLSYSKLVRCSQLSFALTLQIA